MTGFSAGYRAFRQAMKEIWKAEDAPCALCGHRDIDYDSPAYQPDAFELDHRKPRKKFPELELDPNNAQPSHFRCNRAKGVGDNPLAIGVTSEAW